MELTVDKYTYVQLLTTFPPIPIHSEEDHTNALKVINSLMIKDSLNNEETTLLELWAILVEDYERDDYPVVTSKPYEVLKHLLEAKDLPQSSLVEICGSKSTVSEIVNGKRPISKKLAKKLGDYFKVEFNTFL
jgi:HTH-type transcriptional regulator/antitoxin HigA